MTGTAQDQILSKPDWLTMKGLADGHKVFINPEHKGSYVLLSCSVDNQAEKNRHVQDKKTYKSNSFKLRKVTAYFILLRKGNVKYFTYKYKKTTKFWNIYFLPKIHNRFFNVPGTPVISNCGTSTAKVSEFLDQNLHLIMSSGWSYIDNADI